MNTATTGSEEDANSKELCSTFDSGKMLFKMTASSCGQDEEDQLDDGRGRGRGHGPDPDNHVQSNMFLIHIVNFLLHYEPRDFITNFHATGLSTWTPDPVQPLGQHQNSLVADKANDPSGKGCSNLPKPYRRRRSRRSLASGPSW